MADINTINRIDITNTQANNVNNASANIRVQKADTNSEKPAEILKEQREASEKRAEELKDVVAVSEDGDTVQAKEDSIAKLDDENKTVIREGVPEDRDNSLSKISDALDKVRKSVNDVVEADKQRTEDIKEAEDNRKRTEEVKDDAAQAVQNDEEDEKQYNAQIASYATYTDQQLQQMYIKGEISKTDYDQEMDARAEKTEDLKENNNQFTQNMSEKIVLTEETERDAAQLQTAFSPDANNNTTTAEQRVKLMDALEDITITKA